MEKWPMSEIHFLLLLSRFLTIFIFIIFCFYIKHDPADPLVIFPCLTHLKQFPYLSHLKQFHYLTDLRQFPYLTDLKQFPCLTHLKQLPYLTRHS